MTSTPDIATTDSHSIARVVQSLRDIDGMGGLIIYDKANREFYSDGAIAEICRSGSAVVIVLHGRKREDVT